MQLGARRFWPRFHGLADDFARRIQLRAVDFHARGAHASATDAEFLLYELDELDEFRNSVQTEQREEPAVEFEGFLGLAVARVVEKVHGFARQRTGQARDPARGTHANAFDDGVIHADENFETIADERADGADAADVCARFLDGVKILVFSLEFLNLLGQEIGAVSDRIVVKHRGEAGGFDYSGYVRLHLRPVALVNVGREHHHAITSGSFSGFRERDCFRRGERRNRGDDARLSLESLGAGLHDGDFLGKRESGAFAERTQRDNASAAVFYEPLDVVFHERMIHLSFFVETGGNCRHHAFPLHRDPPFDSPAAAPTAAKLEHFTGNTGGRAESISQSNKN